MGAQVIPFFIFSDPIGLSQSVIFDFYIAAKAGYEDPPFFYVCYSRLSFLSSFIISAMALSVFSSRPSTA